MEKLTLKNEEEIPRVNTTRQCENTIIQKEKQDSTKAPGGVGSFKHINTKKDHSI